MYRSSNLKIKSLSEIEQITQQDTFAPVEMGSTDVTCAFLWFPSVCTFYRLQQCDIFYVRCGRSRNLLRKLAHVINSTRYFSVFVCRLPARVKYLIFLTEQLFAIILAKLRSLFALLNTYVRPAHITDDVFHRMFVIVADICVIIMKSSWRSGLCGCGTRESVAEPGIRFLGFLCSTIMCESAFMCLCTTEARNRQSVTSLGNGQILIMITINAIADMPIFAKKKNPLDHVISRVSKPRQLTWQL